ncbi:uncharacterized protein LOC133180116 [Saccostrea echinata]|uniref:uncharacterized protein LOC133180116 n=1 Tax=Saccostrea echinata TaxID=191078 RepID=UPI002A840845|nr:uncharacterized protein LOC133180116 [Saccostrea echinata]
MCNLELSFLDSNVKFCLSRESNTRTSSPSRSFGDFEEEWIRLGEESYVGVFESGNSPKDPYVFDNVPSGGVKRKISETEDSLILTRRKLGKSIPSYTQQRDEEDQTLKKFRKDNPAKYEALKRRTFAIGYSPPCPSPPPIKAELDPQAPDFAYGYNPCPTPPIKSEFALGYSPSSPICVPSSPASSLNLSSTPTEFNSILNLPTSDHTLTPTARNTPVLPAVPSGTGTPASSQTSRQYPLKEELSALSELIDSVRVDLLQTSMIVNYMQDYLKCLK